LEQYLVDVPAVDACDPSMKVPRFVFPSKFDAREDTLLFDWTNPNSFLEKLRK